MGFRDGLHGLRHLGADLLSRFRVERADRTGEFRRRGDDVRRRGARHEAADRNHDRLRRIDAARHDRLERPQPIPAPQGWGRLPSAGAPVPALPFDGRVEEVGGGLHGPHLEPHLPPRRPTVRRACRRSRGRRTSGAPPPSLTAIAPVPISSAGWKIPSTRRGNRSRLGAPPRRPPTTSCVRHARRCARTRGLGRIGRAEASVIGSASMSARSAMGRGGSLRPSRRVRSPTFRSRSR